DRGTAYMAYTDRVGPGILIATDDGSITDEARSIADGLAVEGFTAIVPDLGAGAPERLFAAAVDYLADNWHPRVGLISFGRHDFCDPVIESRRIDAIALYEEGTGLIGEELDADIPTVRHDVAAVQDPDAIDETLDFFRYHLS
ncbi:MAG TPA: dienelactone hydrolase family protein, partial [Actinomycetota bacterium]|nr:dienelactone hydrolase family protein [Actinomycetota bacterium]